MKVFLISLTLLMGQMTSMQDRPVIHLKPHSNLIESGFAGSILELQNAPEYLHLPKLPPKPDGQGNQWFVDIKNFGPHPVVVDDTRNFSLQIGVSQTVHIYSNGTLYYQKH
ncbi:hypothetical protein [Acidicapsa acidisoli]|uniref:hypothetical protein n=1 Tax=Acidicapsa acidisoli TaxID=1615681 RepID=UPI0021DFC0FB|nr:hypothetical protein [Acidicapsa acidisoli]